jgi:hypothetical protein
MEFTNFLPSRVYLVFFKSMTGVALSGSCNSPIQGEKRDLSRVFHPELWFSIILTRVKILVVFITIAGQKIVKALTLNRQRIVGLCNLLRLMDNELKYFKSVNAQHH